MQRQSATGFQQEEVGMVQVDTACTSRATSRSEGSEAPSAEESTIPRPQAFLLPFVLLPWYLTITPWVGSKAFSFL